MAKLRFTLKFSENLSEIADFIASDSVVLAKKFVRDLLSRVKILENNPHLGRVVPEKNNPTIREIFFGSYRIVYRYKKEDVEILMVRHTARLR